MKVLRCYSSVAKGECRSPLAEQRCSVSEVRLKIRAKTEARAFDASSRRVSKLCLCLAGLPSRSPHIAKRERTRIPIINRTMPPLTSRNRQADQGAVSLSNNENYDDAVNEFLRDLPAGDNTRDAGDSNANNDGPKNMDEEVKIKKKREPVPKLDENRLLSRDGIPRLRKITKQRLKFRGKGHEFSDISRLLGMYQLWLDDLYPRAKFRDALSTVEKLGHKKRMQVMRRAWLDDTKPGRRETSPERLGDLEMSGALGGDDPMFGDLYQSHANGGEDDMLRDAGAHASRNGTDTIPDDAPGDDELDALLAEGPTAASAANPTGNNSNRQISKDEDELDAINSNATESRAPAPQQKSEKRVGPFEDEGSDEDDLDALLAEQQTSDSAPQKRAEPRPNDFADEEDVMASMGGEW